MIVPPDNYALVEDGIYRCSRLDPINQSFLETLNLKSLLWIDEEKPSRTINQYIEDNNVKLFHLKNSSILPEEDDNDLVHHVRFQEWMVLKPSLISKIFQILLDLNNHDVLLVDKTEVVVGILRHIQRWSYSSISNEYRLYSNSKANYAVEVFLELITIELIPHEDEILQLETEEGSNTDELAVEEKEENDDDHYDYEDDESNGLHDIEEDDEDVSHYDNSGASTAQSIPMTKRDNLSSSLNNNSSYNGGSFKRRVSFATSAGKSPSQAQSFGSKLSMSSSPQIPKNLLKLVEMRKQKKQRHKEASHHESNNTLEFPKDNKSSELKAMSTTGDTYANTTDVYLNDNGALLTQQLKSNLVLTPEDEPASFTTNSSSSDASPVPDHSSATRPRGGVINFYQPNKDFRFINDKNKRINSTIKIRLPKEENLPLWFVQLREQWEEEFVRLNCDASI